MKSTFKGLSAVMNTTYNMSSERRVMHNCPFMDFSLVFASVTQ